MLCSEHCGKLYPKPQWSETIWANECKEWSQIYACCETRAKTNQELSESATWLNDFEYFVPEGVKSY